MELFPKHILLGACHTIFKYLHQVSAFIMSVYMYVCNVIFDHYIWTRNPILLSKVKHTQKGENVESKASHHNMMTMNETVFEMLLRAAWNVMVLRLLVSNSLENMNMNIQDVIDYKSTITLHINFKNAGSKCLLHNNMLMWHSGGIEQLAVRLLTYRHVV